MQAYINGKIYEEKDVFHEALLVDKNRILLVGSNDEIIQQLNTEDETIDLEGRTVLPGLIDTHLHFLMTAEYLEMLQINDVTSMKELIKRGQEYITEKGLTKEDFLYTEGWNQNQFTDEQRIPTRNDLDQISVEVPVGMARVDRHIVSLNSAALEYFGISETTLSPEGGEIRKDERGKPTGVLTERAIDLIRKKLPKKSPEQQKDMIIRTMQLANSQGLTSVHACDCKDENIKDTFEFYKKIEDDMTLRVYHQIWFNDGTYLKDYLAEGYSTGQGTSYNKIGPVKLFADGALGGRTAAMRKDYADDPGNPGILTKSQETLNHEVQLSHHHGNQIIIHAIGDRAIENVLNAYDTVVGNENRYRHGINHVQITDQGLLERIKEKDYLAYVQPIFLEDDIPIVEKRVGKELARTSYAFGTLAKMGVHQSFSTDSPIAPFQPFRNIYCALTRKQLNGEPVSGFQPSEAVDIYTAIDAYTYEGAYASFEEKEKGRLKPGYLADFIVLDRDVFTISPEEIKETQVLMTVVDGKVVYESERV